MFWCLGVSIFVALAKIPWRWTFRGKYMITDITLNLHVFELHRKGIKILNRMFHLIATGKGSVSKWLDTDFFIKRWKWLVLVPCDFCSWVLFFSHYTGVCLIFLLFLFFLTIIRRQSHILRSDITYSIRSSEWPIWHGFVTSPCSYCIIYKSFHLPGTV